MTGAELKEIRERSGMLQPEFAERLGIHSVTLSRFERDRQPIPLTVELAIHELDRRLSAPMKAKKKTAKKRKAAPGLAAKKGRK